MSYPDAVLERLPAASKPWFDGGAGITRLNRTLTGSAVREIWKYTPIKSFVEKFADLTSASALEVTGLDQPGIQALGLAGLDGPDLELARGCLAQVDGSRYPVADLTLLDSADGLLLKVSGQPAEAISLKTLDGGRHLVVIDVAPGAALSLIEESSARDFNTQLVYLRAGAGARIHHVRSALESSAMQWSLLMADLDSDSSYTLSQFQVGGKRRRTDGHFRLVGRGARVDVTGAYLTEEGCHLDQQVIVEHQARDTVSRQKFHGIGTGKSRAVFNGRIHIHNNAPASDALLTNRNLSLSPGAEIDTKPELEIYTDDVRCAHGATVGQLSEESLFYLRSRGMTEPAARELLCRGFLRECISGPLAEQVTARLTGALQQ